MEPVYELLTVHIWKLKPFNSNLEINQIELDFSFFKKLMGLKIESLRKNRGGIGNKGNGFGERRRVGW